MQPTVVFVSIFIRCYNERPSIEEPLGSVLRQGYPGDRFEMFVVCGWSTGGTHEIMSRIATRDCRLRLVDNPARLVHTPPGTCQRK